MTHFFAGKYPTATEVMRHKIMDSCIHCITKKGMNKTSVQDIANEAGIARQTVYKHFENKTAIFAETFQREGLTLALEIQKAIRSLKAKDAFTEAFIHVVTRFPRNPILAQLISRGSSFLNDVGMKYFAFSDFGEVVFYEIFKENPKLLKDSEEISELWTRNALSMISFPSQRRKSEYELRNYVERRLIPGLDLR